MLSLPTGGGATAALRGVTPPDTYGLRVLTADAKASVKKETFVALRSWDCGTHTLAPDRSSRRRADSVSPARSPRLHHGWITLMEVSVMKTALLGNVSFHDVPRVAARTLPDAASGENYFAPDLAAQRDYWWFSTVKSILTEDPTSSMAIASLDPPPASTVTPGMRFTDKLRGEQADARELRDRVDGQSLAGLRNTAEAISRLPVHRQLGSILPQLFANVLREKPHLTRFATGTRHKGTLFRIRESTV